MRCKRSPPTNSRRSRRLKTTARASSVPQKTFRQLLGMVHFAMAQQDIRYYLNGMLLVVDGDQLMAVATDGHRLAFSSMKIEGSFARQEVIIPRKTILELQRLLEDIDDTLKIDIAQTQVKFTFGQVELVSKLVEGKFPDFQRVIPKSHKNTFVIGREELQRSLQRAAILTSDKFKGVRCIIEPGQLKIMSTNADQEEAQEELEIAYRRRQRRYRVQRHVSARRAREPEGRHVASEPRRRQFQRADHDSRERRIQIRGDADAHLTRPIPRTHQGAQRPFGVFKVI